MAASAAARCSSRHRPIRMRKATFMRGMFREALRLASVVLVLSGAFAAIAAAEPAEKRDARWAAVSLEEVDADFRDQGEYLGWVCEQGCRRSCGLQVVALGDGAFLAAEYLGGLPGNGWSKDLPRREWRGRREKHGIVLPRADGMIRISAGRAEIYRGSGSDATPVGVLCKVERTSVTLGLCPPHCADVLFDGTDTGLLKNLKIAPDGTMEVGAETVRAYRDFRLHLEFRLPYMPYARGQGRGNSGVYLQRRYEVQILDSFGLEGRSNECGGLYRQREPDVNMCFAPLSWQTYDIDFRAARFDSSGRKIQPARITVWHNGVVVHDHVDLKGKTGAGRPEGPEPLPILFQNHGNPVRFRNVWLIDYSRLGTTATVARHRRAADPLRLGAVFESVFSGQAVR
ncbi:MAG: DUF1080 domain-containing protein [Planctomycetota bacterium]|nr:MAG: DUF1080 domain-containing protein [Planctomycetota bacterium]